MVHKEDAPALVEILQEEEAIKIYWHQRDQLHLRYDILYRQMIGGDEQVVVPASLRGSYISLAQTNITEDISEFGGQSTRSDYGHIRSVGRRTSSDTANAAISVVSTGVGCRRHRGFSNPSHVENLGSESSWI